MITNAVEETLMIEDQEKENTEQKKKPKPELEVIWFEQGDIISST